MQPNEPQATNTQPVNEATTPQPNVVSPTPASEQPAVSPFAAQQPSADTTTATAVPSQPSVSPVDATTPGAGPVVTQPVTSASNAPGGNRKKPLLIAGGAVVLVAVIVVALFLTVFSHKISAQDVSTALQASDNISSDIGDLSGSIDELQSASTTDEVSSKVNLINSKLADAAKQYDTLKNSPVQHDTTVHQKFTALDSKWSPFTSYIKDSSSDYAAYEPIFIGLQNDLDAATKDAPTTQGQLGGYLTKIKSVIDTASQKSNGLKLKVSENQKALTSLQKFLGSASQAVSKAQSDLAAGKDSFTIEDDLFSIDDAQTSLDSDLTSLDNQISDHEKQIDPESAFNSFQSALEDLQQKVTK